MQRLEELHAFVHSRDLKCANVHLLHKCVNSLSWTHVPVRLRCGERLAVVVPLLAQSASYSYILIALCYQLPYPSVHSLTLLLFWICLLSLTVNLITNSYHSMRRHFVQTTDTTLWILCWLSPSRKRDMFIWRIMMYVFRYYSLILYKFSTFNYFPNFHFLPNFLPRLLSNE